MQTVMTLQENATRNSHKAEAKLNTIVLSAIWVMQRTAKWTLNSIRTKPYSHNINVHELDMCIGCLLVEILRKLKLSQPLHQHNYIIILSEQISNVHSWAALKCCRWSKAVYVYIYMTLYGFREHTTVGQCLSQYNNYANGTTLSMTL